MTDREVDSGLEIVVDNRKRIIAFAVIILVCGCFFVWGFMAGKRQGMKLSAITNVDTAAGAGMEGALTPAAEIEADSAEVPSLDEEAVQQDLDWYQSVNKKGSEPVGVQPPRPSSIAKKEPVTSSASNSTVKPDTAMYSVQVGAFKRRPEAEAHALNIRSRGFDSRVEDPGSSGQLYLVKVGKFDTRAEAVAVQNRLKKSGFSCFVKTN